jgi:hypothetical protein
LARRDRPAGTAKSRIRAHASSWTRRRKPAQRDESGTDKSGRSRKTHSVPKHARRPSFIACPGRLAIDANTAMRGCVRDPKRSLVSVVIPTLSIAIVRATAGRTTIPQFYDFCIARRSACLQASSARRAGAGPLSNALRISQRPLSLDGSRYCSFPPDKSATGKPAR